MDFELMYAYSFTLHESQIYGHLYTLLAGRLFL